MKAILTEISKAFGNADEKAPIVNYFEMRKHDGWVTHQKMLLMMRGMIADKVLSSRFTELDEREKDVRQRTYHGINEVIGFLLNPLEKAIKKAQFEQNFEREMREQMGATRRGQPQGRSR